MFDEKDAALLATPAPAPAPAAPQGRPAAPAAAAPAPAVADESRRSLKWSLPVGQLRFRRVNEFAATGLSRPERIGGQQLRPASLRNTTWRV